MNPKRPAIFAAPPAIMFSSPDNFWACKSNLIAETISVRCVGKPPTNFRDCKINPHFSGLSDETLKQGLVSVWPSLLSTTPPPLLLVKRQLFSARIDTKIVHGNREAEKTDQNAVHSLFLSLARSNLLACMTTCSFFLIKPLLVSADCYLFLWTWYIRFYRLGDRCIPLISIQRAKVF